MGYIYGQLSQNERLEIYHFNRQGLSIRAIGRRLYRAASTISREIVRNSHVRKQWEDKAFLSSPAIGFLLPDGEGSSSSEAIGQQKF
ncbi:MAG: helix-turn-helix domain-containing protein [Robiginitomaculum sp.]|nr:helix-turn-helix domain-containing protein [Robiginitomaculum sp.]